MNSDSSGLAMVGRILSEASLSEEVLGQAVAPALIDRLVSELEQISEEITSVDSGGTLVIVAGRHVCLSNVAWKLLTSGAALAISTLDPTGITKAAALMVVLDLVKELRPLFKKLDPAKLLICGAIAAVSADKKRRSVAKTGATEQEIIDYFTQRDEVVPVHLEDNLKSLEADKVVKADYYQLSGPYYSVRF